MDCGFQFKTGDVVLVEWMDKLYYAKILHIDYLKRMCSLLFDDDSIDHCPFTKIHSVTETTAEIVCIVCKDGSSVRPNEIVLCDKCGIGYHQQCHNPFIEDKTLEPDEPWMCVYCTQGCECPYLLNPFEAKRHLKDFASMSGRKSREDPKESHYNMSKHASSYIPSKPSRVRNLMANYYHDQRRGGMDASHVRHMAREAHHVMNRRGVMERPRSKYYRYPDDRSSEKVENFESRKRRLADQQEKNKTSQDVWDNGGYAADVTDNDVTADDVSKLKGKEGPREKQRLTQDLERQRKKLKEDMKRGQELQREHNQLLTRDQMHDQSRDVTISPRDHISEDAARNERSYDDRKYERRHYSHDGGAEYSENVRNSSGKRARSEYRSADVRVNGEGPGDKTSNKKLDPCNCNETTGINENIYNISDKQCEHSSSRQDYHEINGHASDTREIHDHAGITGDKHGQATKEMYSSEKIEVLGESSDNEMTCNDTRDKSKVKSGEKIGGVNHYEVHEYQGLRKERRSKEGNKPRSGSVKSDKESLRDSSSGTKRGSCSDESVDNDHRGNKRHKAEGANHEDSRKTPYENDATENRMRSDFPRHNWLVERWINQKTVPTNEKPRGTGAEETHRSSVEGCNEPLETTRECTSINNVPDEISATQTSGSPVYEQTYKDEVIDEGYTKQIVDDGLAKDAGEFGERHENEILKVPSPVKYENYPQGENNNSPEIEYSATKNEPLLSSRNLDNGSPEIIQYSETNKVQASPKTEKTSPLRVETSPKIPETSPKRVETSPKPTQESPKRVQLSPHQLFSTDSVLPTSTGTSCVLPDQQQTFPNLAQSPPNERPLPLNPILASPSKLPPASNSTARSPEQIPQSPNRIAEATSGSTVSPAHRVPTNNCIPSPPNQVQYSPNRIPPSPNRIQPSPNRIPPSPNRIQPSPNRVPAFPDKKTPSPNSASESPGGVPPSPHWVTTNTIPETPNQVQTLSDKVQTSPRRVSPSQNRISPNDKSRRSSSSGSGQHIETRRISPRFTPRIDQDFGGNQEELRRSRNRIGSRDSEYEAIHPGGIRRESQSGGAEEKIIEVTSDGEESKRESSEENKEFSKIQTGRSVNPVSPIVRPDKHVMEEMHSGIHQPRIQDLKSLRAPTELPPGLPLTYAAYSTKTFSPHLITHNAGVMHHPGHPALQGGLSGRLEISQHTKPDMNCPFHGKKVDKMPLHVPGYPVLHGDAHMYSQHALHESEAALKLRDKRPEHLEFPSDPLAMQRRMPAVYDRHLVMPHGIPMHHPRFLAPGIVDEHGFPLDSERYKHRLEAAHAYTGIHKPQSHAPSGVSADSSRYAGSTSEGKRHALKYTDEKRDTPKDNGMPSEGYRHPHREQSPMMSHSDRNEVMKRYNISPQDTRSSRVEHVLRTRPGSHGNYTPSVRQMKEAHPGFIQLGEVHKEKPGPESRPSPSPKTLDRESINRDFNERFSMLDKTFKEKLEGTDRNREGAMAAYSAAQRRHGNEIGGPPKAWGENQGRPVDPLKHRHLEKHVTSTKNTPQTLDEQRKLQDHGSPRIMVTSSHTPIHKSPLPMSSYRFHGNMVPGSPHGLPRGMVPVMANHGDFGVWQGMRGTARIPGYPPANLGTKETQGIAPEKNERLKQDYTTAQREYQDKERSLAIEKHRMNLAQLENEKRKAFLAGMKDHERRPESAEHEARSPRTREEEMRRTWEVENRKRKLEQPGADISQHARAQAELSKRLMTEKTHHMPIEELASRKEQYLAVCARQHEGYGTPAVPYPDRARSAGNPPFFMGRIGHQAEASVSEALRKQREHNQRHESMRKMVKKNNRCMCGVCGKEASFLCSGCQKAWYCSAKCQHTAWADHCKECTESKRK
ncbi:uncharacterized protein LOC114523863 isoform X2 [Dendronephthya gigantea]|uniref:uncharacterized protein LOC114523863 isoform X2 n=1 Tax=Dendronephthya gigantea TaxID=151771 RepID=UPI001068F248|nr:uncharacterized protein LOC114523863 isoform X2 [Dendronephthya gigantea]